MEILFGILGLLLPFSPLLIGWLVGGYMERSHFKRIERDRKDLSDMLVTQLKSFPHDEPSETAPRMVMGEVVISSDYLKNFLTKIRNIFGGEMKSLNTLLVRAREEAMIRMLKSARKGGYNAVCNVRLETAEVGSSKTAQKTTVMVSMIASGTAYNADFPAQDNME